MRLMFAFLVCLSLPPVAVAQGVIASLRAGVVCGPPVVGSAPAPDTIAGSTHLIEETPPFIAEITQVPAVIGIGFGVKAQAADPDGLSGVTMIVTHPPMGDAGVTRQSYTSWISGTEPSMTFYQFDEDYERVTGTWTFTAVLGDEELFSVDFEVVPPQALPGLAEACGYGDLLS
ncbi:MULTISPECIES: DUF3859 domain-containing protein [unclassified Yoonia]|uniref:DUF3859 domain-containing protein n=1 Tax=unclassified Yoonia TaxID=2629118 RepID=UPI002AFE7854|nr:MULTISPECIES: DUF3859 domain-containing protein [unclassified Yoonia]